MIRTALSTALLIAVATNANAQRKLDLSERLRLDAAAEDFSALTVNRQGNAPFYVGPRREIILPLNQDRQVRIYDSTGKRVTTLGRNGEGPGEYRSIFRLGWSRDTIWVYDALLRRITFYDGKYALVRSMVLSDALRQKVEGDNPRAISDFAPSAIAADGNVLGQIIEINGRDPATSRLLMSYHVAAVSPEAAIRKLVEIPPQAVAPRAWVATETPGRTAYATVPFANDAVYAFSTAGDRFAIVTTDRPAKTFTVTVRNGTGATIFSRAYPFTPRPIPASVIDSAVQAAPKMGRPTGAVLAHLNEETRKLVPPSYPPVSSVVLARDGTTWIRTTDASGKDEALVLDAKGTVTATVALPRTVDIVEAEGNRVWAIDVDADDLASVVVFTTKPAGSGR